MNSLREIEIFEITLLLRYDLDTLTI